MVVETASWFMETPEGKGGNRDAVDCTIIGDRIVKLFKKHNPVPSNWLEELMLVLESACITTILDHFDKFKST